MAEPKSQPSKRRIVEVVASKPPPPPAPKREPDDDPVVKIPLELWPVIRTLVGYGRRTHGLGALRGAAALEQFSAALVPFFSRVPELAAVSAAAHDEAQAIRSLSQGSLTGEQDNDD